MVLRARRIVAKSTIIEREIFDELEETNLHIYLLIHCRSRATQLSGRRHAMDALASLWRGAVPAALDVLKVSSGATRRDLDEVW